MFGAQLKDRKRSLDMVVMFGLNETRDNLAMAINVYWYAYVLWMAD